MPSIPAEALFDACCSGDAAAVSRLLPAGGTSLDLSGQNFRCPNFKNTPLLVAVLEGHADIVRMILERAPNTAVDYATAQSFTALMAAAGYHHADILRLLADRGADMNRSDLLGATPLCHAVAVCHPDQQPRAPDPEGKRQLATVRALLRLGAGTLPPRTPPLGNPF